MKEAIVENAPWVRAVEKAWAAIRKPYPDVPAVHLALGPQLTKATHRLAHFAAYDPVPELMVSYAAQVNLDGEQMMGVLVHEATHGLAIARGIEATSDRGRWHNDRFTHLAGEMGLMLITGRPSNMGADRLNPIAVMHYAPVIRALDAARPQSRSA